MFGELFIFRYHSPALIFERLHRNYHFLYFEIRDIAKLRIEMWKLQGVGENDFDPISDHNGRQQQ